MIAMAIAAMHAEMKALMTYRSLFCNGPIRMCGLGFTATPATDHVTHPLQE